MLNLLMYRRVPFVWISEMVLRYNLGIESAVWDLPASHRNHPYLNQYYTSRLPSTFLANFTVTAAQAHHFKRVLTYEEVPQIPSRILKIGQYEIQKTIPLRYMGLEVLEIRDLAARISDIKVW